MRTDPAVMKKAVPSYTAKSQAGANWPEVSTLSNEGYAGHRDIDDAIIAKRWSCPS
jgi:hypothetical protein